MAAGGGGMGLRAILLDPANPKRIVIAISAAGAFRTDDGGQSWKAINRDRIQARSSRPDRGSWALRS